MQAKSFKVRHTLNMPIIANVLHWISGLVLTFLSAYCFKKSSNNLGLYFSLFLAQLALWSFCTAITFHFPLLETKISINRIKLIGVVWIPITIFYMIRCYVHAPRPPRIVQILLLVVPSAAAMLVFTPYHELLVGHYQIESIFGSSVLTFKNGPVFYWHNVETRFVVMWAMAGLVQATMEQEKVRRKTNWILFFSILLPFFIDTVVVSFFPYLIYLQIVPIFMTFSSIAFYDFIFRGNAFELIPIARGMAIDSISDIYLVLDHKEHIIDLNSFAKQALELGEKYYRRSLNDLNTDNEIIEHIIYLLKENKETYFFSVKTHQDRVYYSVTTNKIFENSGAYLGKILIIKNITDQKRHEEQLSQMVEIRTKFINLIAHDLINNIAGHSFFIESLVEHPSVKADEDLKANLDFLSHSSKNVTEFIESLLLWSKENMQKIDLKKTQSNLKVLIEESINLLQPHSLQKDIDYQVNGPDNLYVNVDSNMILTVLRNMIANAIKFSPENGLINISTNIQNEKIAVSISDEGPGVNEMELNQFMQELGIGSYQGGVGLMLCKDFIRLHEGEITVKNNPQKGTTFTFTLPAI